MRQHWLHVQIACWFWLENAMSGGEQCSFDNNDKTHAISAYTAYSHLKDEFAISDAAITMTLKLGHSGTHQIALLLTESRSLFSRPRVKAEKSWKKLCQVPTWQSSMFNLPIVKCQHPSLFNFGASLQACCHMASRVFVALMHMQAMP